MTVTDAVHDIAFAPNLGRSFHILAIATKDVRIFKLIPMRWTTCFCAVWTYRTQRLDEVAEILLSHVGELMHYIKKLLKWKSNLPCYRKESTSTGPTKFEVQILAQFDNHNSQVWRVSWNITSTLLASSGDDGCVRLWKGGRICYLLLITARSSMFSLCTRLVDCWYQPI